MAIADLTREIEETKGRPKQGACEQELLCESSLRLAIAQAHSALCELSSEESIQFVLQGAARLFSCFRAGKKLLIAGNGGSMCDAMHFAEELTGYFRARRAPLPAIALADPGHISCVSNDHCFEEVFARSIEALCQEGDCVVLLSTSGNSPNIVRAYDAARAKKASVITFLGRDGGALRGRGDLELIIEGFGHSDRIQEVHMSAIHMMIEQLELLLKQE